MNRQLTLPSERVHQSHLFVTNIHHNAKSRQQANGWSKETQYLGAFSWMLCIVLTFLYTAIISQKWVLLQSPGGHNMKQSALWCVPSYSHSSSLYKINSTKAPNTVGAAKYPVHLKLKIESIFEMLGFPIKTSIMNKVSELCTVSHQCQRT
jgi:hypothetical protein